jgi:hypothetical protein
MFSAGFLRRGNNCLPGSEGSQARLVDVLESERVVLGGSRNIPIVITEESAVRGWR